MDDKKLVFIAIVSSVATCGLLAPPWIIGLSIYFIIKAFIYRPKHKTETVSAPKPKVIMPDNSFAEDWVFVIKPPTEDHLSFKA